MPQVIDISDEEILYAERLLLPAGKEFDDERKAFIRNFNTIDLQAVPGSGKTTALLAKLIIIERKLPFADGSGILVLSHTNAAIDEIKEKIQRHCPRLFSYPNFIGTIQSFVDEFLTIPMFIHWRKHKPTRIDSEIFWETFLRKLSYGSKQALELRLGNKFKTFIEEITIGKDGKLIHFDTLDEIDIPKIGSHTKTYKNLFSSKNDLLRKGILNYNDAYTFANSYLKKYPIIKRILQKRFPFVFVDEMQDMDTHQYNLLENIFYDEGNSLSKIQRIGDKNQAIYNSVKADDIWVDRPKVLRLNGSQRLSKHIANVVKRFALYNDETFDIVGKNECEIKPHILVFENTNIKNIFPCFAQIVKENGLENSEKPIKAICWNTEWKENEESRSDTAKLRLEDYHKGFTKDNGKPKHDYDNLKSYLLYYEKTQTLEPIRKNILNAFLKVLRLEDINTVDQRSYTKKKLIDFIREKDVQKYDELNLNLYNWSIGILREKTNEVLTSIKKYIPTLLTIFDKQISASLNFINNDNSEIPVKNAEILAPTNYYKEDGLEIEITSVHAVKGQTHCATLYLESYFQQDGQKANAKSYESQRLKDQFLGLPIQSNVGGRVKQSAKMAYVGFSRPTDLLCVAIHKDRFSSLLNEIDKEIWEVRKVF